MAHLHVIIQKCSLNLTLPFSVSFPSLINIQNESIHLCGWKNKVQLCATKSNERHLAVYEGWFEFSILLFYPWENLLWLIMTVENVAAEILKGKTPKSLDIQIFFAYKILYYYIIAVNYKLTGVNITITCFHKILQWLTI